MCLLDSSLSVRIARGTTQETLNEFTRNLILDGLRRILCPFQCSFRPNSFKDQFKLFSTSKETTHLHDNDQFVNTV